VAATVPPVVVDKPVKGPQIYLTPPVARSVSADPLQTAGANETTAITGSGFTVHVTEAVLTHPFASVPMTVYVKDDTVDTVCVAVMELPTVSDKPVEGLQM
jgi:hypothetical protein